MPCASATGATCGGLPRGPRSSRTPWSWDVTCWCPTNWADCSAWTPRTWEARSGGPPASRKVLAASKQRVYAADAVGRLMVLDGKTGAIVDGLSTELLPIKLTNSETDRLFLADKTGLVQCLHEIGLTEPVLRRLPPRDDLAATGDEGKPPRKPPTTIRRGLAALGRRKHSRRSRVAAARRAAARRRRRAPGKAPSAGKTWSRRHSPISRRSPAAAVPAAWGRAAVGSARGGGLGGVGLAWMEDLAAWGWTLEETGRFPRR